MSIEQPEIYTHLGTREFLIAAIAEGAHLKQPSVPRRPTEWVRYRNITGAYFLSDAPQRDIATAYARGSTRLSGERIRQIIEATMRNIHKNCSPELQAQYPFEQIPLKKPFSRKMREHQSLGKTGASVSLARMLEAGVPLQEAKKSLDIPGSILSAHRRVLHNWGVDVPYLYRTLAEKNALIENLKNPNLTDQQIQELLDQINHYEVKSKLDDTAFLSVIKAARILGYRFWPRNFDILIRILELASIPFSKLQVPVKNGPQRGIHTYHLLATQHLQRFKEALSSTPELDRYLTNPPS